MSRRKGRKERESTTVKISGVAFNIVTSSWAFSSCTFGYIPNLCEICGHKLSVLSVNEFVFACNIYIIYICTYSTYILYILDISIYFK